MKNYYKILDLKPGASQEEINKQYKKLSKKYHPDLFTDPEEKAKAEEKFKEISEAKEYLTKHKYHNQFNIKPTIQVYVHFTLEELYNKVEKEVEYEIGEDICPHCEGSGMFSQVQKTPFGIIQQTSTCSHCKGTGRCGNIIKKNLKIKLDYFNLPNIIPESDYNIKLIYTKDSKSIFEMDYSGNLFYELKLDLIDCLLGGEFEIPFFNNESLKLKIPECSFNKKRFRLKEKGINNMDLFVDIETIYPEKLTKEQHKLLEQWNKK